MGSTLVPRNLRRVRSLSAAVLLTILFCASSLWAHAADGDEDEDPGQATHAAMLSLNYDARGTAEVNFYSDEAVPDWGPLQAALEHAIHCTAGVLVHPQPTQYRYLQSLPQKQLAPFQEQAAKQQMRTLQGTCKGAMTHNGFLLSTGLRLDSVLAELGKVGDQQFEMNVTYNATRSSQHFRARPISGSSDDDPQFQYAHYEFDVASASPSGIHLEFGLRKNDVIRNATLPLVFLILPIVIVLWMQHAAIRDAQRDPTAAWFSYFRILNWCTSGLMLVWNVGHSIRQCVENLAAYNLAGNDIRAVALKVAILLLPPWIVYLVCILSSYRVYVNVRGNSWKRSEFYATQSLQLASQFLPLACLICGLEMLPINSRVSMAFFVSIYFVLVLCTRLKLKISGTHPEALTTGELRDRVFGLAKQAAVELRQIFIVPAGKSELANAFASRNRIVMFTDYLLSRLNKREVSAVAAHEITHLQKQHVMWKTIGFIALMFSPSIFRWVLNFGLGFLRLATISVAQTGPSKAFVISQQIQNFPELDLVLFSIGLSLFYLQSRYMENSADAGAVQLTRDPEAVITGLLKLGHLNLLPTQWGRVTGSLLTHPSTLKRVQRVARIGQVSPERLAELLSRYEQESQSGTQDLPQPEDIFAEESVPQNRILSTARTSQSASNKLWILLLCHLAPPIAIAWSVQHWHLKLRLAIYVLGAILCVALYAFVIRWLGLWGRAKVNREFMSKLKSEGIVTNERDALMVGLSPHSILRFYVSGYNWDVGYLFFTRQGICYVGDQLRFALRSNQIRSVLLGPGVSGWFSSKRVYVNWWDETSNTLRTWNLASVMPCSIWNVQQSAELFAAMQRWQAHSEEYPEVQPALKNLTAPATGEVTSRDPKSLYSLMRSFGNALWILVLAFVFCKLFSVPVTYVCCVVLLLRLYESLPHWLHKEAKQVAPPPAPVVVGEI